MFNFNTPNLIDVEIDNNINGKLYIVGGLYVPALAKKFRISSLPLTIKAFENVYGTSSLASLEASGGVVLYPITASGASLISKDVLEDSNVGDVVNPFTVDDNSIVDPAAKPNLVLGEDSDTNPFGNEVSDVNPVSVDNTQPPKRMTIINNPVKKKK